MELLNQLDGFEVLSKVKIIMATNRYGPDRPLSTSSDLCCSDRPPLPPLLSLEECSASAAAPIHVAGYGQREMLSKTRLGIVRVRAAYVWLCGVA